jgi:hypothetical protein
MGQSKLKAGWTAQGQPSATAIRLSVPEAAAYCGISVSYLNKLRCTGGGATYITRGRRVIYDTRDLDAWLNSGRRTSTTDAPREVA